VIPRKAQQKIYRSALGGERVKSRVKSARVRDASFGCGKPCLAQGRIPTFLCWFVPLDPDAQASGQTNCRQIQNPAYFKLANPSEIESKFHGSSIIKLRLKRSFIIEIYLAKLV